MDYIKNKPIPIKDTMLVGMHRSVITRLQYLHRLSYLFTKAYEEHYAPINASYNTMLLKWASAMMSSYTGEKPASVHKETVDGGLLLKLSLQAINTRIHSQGHIIETITIKWPTTIGRYEEWLIRLDKVLRMRLLLLCVRHKTKTQFNMLISSVNSVRLSAFGEHDELSHVIQNPALYKDGVEVAQEVRSLMNQADRDIKRYSAYNDILNNPYNLQDALFQLFDSPHLPDILSNNNDLYIFIGRTFERYCVTSISWLLYAQKCININPHFSLQVYTDVLCMTNEKLRIAQ